MVDPGLAGKVVLITGANNPYGIGAGMAQAFAAQGAKIFLHYFRQGEAGSGDKSGASFYRSQQAKSAGEVLFGIRRMGVEADALEADLADARLIPSLYDRAERLGPVEVLVNNAAYWEADTFVPWAPNCKINWWSCGAIGRAEYRPPASIVCLP